VARTLHVLRRGPEAEPFAFSRMDPTAPAGDRSARSNPMTRTAFIIATALSIWACEALAADYNVGTIAISNPWTRATPKGATVAGAYMSISNKGSAPDRLVGGSAAVAGQFEVHSMVMEQGVAKMRPVEGGLEIKPGETVEFKPGSLHVMLTGLKQPLQKGQKVKGTLEFERAGKVDIEYAVEALGATAPAGGGHQH
jgi:periplasmic copper chaperone A